MKELIKKRIMTVLFYLFRVFPIKKNKIVFSSYAGHGYGAEGKCIFESMGSKAENYDIVWLCRTLDENCPSSIRQVPYISIKSIYEQVTARVWVDNRRKAGYVRKRQEQYYIHTWHGGGPCLKWVEKDAESTLSKNYVQSAINDSKMADVLVSGSEWRTQNMKSSFWFNGEILKCDIFKNLNDAREHKRIKEDVYTLFNLDTNVKLFLYAPTFRASGDLTCYKIDCSQIINALSHKYGGRWKIIIRLHPHITEKHNWLTYDDAIDGSMYPQIQDLIMSSEFLMTDYSGCMFEAMELKCKTLLYAVDLEKYLKEERGMYFDITKLPAPLSKNMEELVHTIECFDENLYEQKRKKFVNTIGYYHEYGPEIISNRIDNVIKGEI